MTDASVHNPIENLTPEEEEKFRIHSRIDILYNLRKIMRRNMLISFYFDQSNQFILTSILDVDDKTDKLIIDCGNDQELNKQALNSTKLTFITSLDRIKIEFTSNQISEIEFEDRIVFAVNLPTSLIRIQRRSHYRIPTPIISPIKCIIPVSDHGELIKAEITLIDISCGGIGVIDHHPVISFEPDITYQNCQIDLPGIGCIFTTIKVKNTYEMTLKNGRTCKRAGCEFINLPVEMEAMIQRYVTLKEQSRITP